MPSYGQDAQHILQAIVQMARERDGEIAIQDGFDLYKELVEIRRVHTEVLPE